MALNADSQGFLIGTPMDLGESLDVWRGVREDTRAILGLLRNTRHGGGTEAATPVAPARRFGRTDSAPMQPPVRRGLVLGAREDIDRPTEAPRRTFGMGAETRHTNTLLRQLIRRADGHGRRMAKHLRAIERAIDDLAEKSGRVGGGGNGGWLGGAGAALAGWLGLKKGGGILKGLASGAKTLVGKIPLKGGAAGWWPAAGLGRPQVRPWDRSAR